MMQRCLGAALALTFTTSGGAAQSPSPVTLSGYVRSLTGVQDLGYDPFFTDRRSAFNGEVVRLKWLIEVGDVARVSVHNRVQARWTSAVFNQSVLGLGVSAVPNRTVDLVTDIIDEDDVRVWHDLDRLAITVFTDAVDLTVGRQAITWGISNLFPIADLWAQFSPFELDTEEKPGVDAARALLYPASGLELDIVVADRGTNRIDPLPIAGITEFPFSIRTRHEWSAGIRGTLELPVADIYVAGGKFWDEAIALGGVSLVVDSWKLRAEIAAPWDLDTNELRTIRLTAGIDWIGADLQFSLEYHHNGLGRATTLEYVEVLGSPELARGETYYLGRHYVGTLGAYLPTDRLALSFAALTNVQDPSAALLPAASYDLGQSLRLTVGGLVSLGAKPSFFQDDVRRIFQSEFGTYGSFGYGQVSVYF